MQIVYRRWTLFVRVHPRQRDAGGRLFYRPTAAALRGPKGKFWCFTAPFFFFFLSNIH
jgi:hypothetical protein